MKSRFSIITAIIVSAAVFMLSAAAASAFNPLGQPCQGADAKSSPACVQNSTQNGTTTNPTVKIIRTAADIIAVVAGVAGVITIIISGLMFVTAGGAAPGQRAGDPNRIKNARATLTGTLIGLIIVALAWTIVAFVTDRLVNT